MAVVGMIVHLGRASASAQARELAEGLIADGYVVRAPHEDAETANLDSVEIRDGADFADGLDLVVALGGDARHAGPLAPRTETSTSSPSSTVLSSVNRKLLPNTACSAVRPFRVINEFLA